MAATCAVKRVEVSTTAHRAKQLAARLNTLFVMQLVYELISESSLRIGLRTCSESLHGEARLLNLLHFEGHQLLRGGEEIFTIAIDINFSFTRDPQSHLVN